MSTLVVRELHLHLHLSLLTHSFCPALESPSRYDLRDRGALRPPERYGFTAAALVEPATYREAVVHPDWQHAMAEEIASLERTGTWDLVPLPSHVTPITCKWVYKIKTALMAPLSAIRLVL